MIRDDIKSVVKQGVCKATDWPYVIERFNAVSGGVQPGYQRASIRGGTRR